MEGILYLWALMHILLVFCILFAQFGKYSVKEMPKHHFSYGQSTALSLSSIWYLPTYLHQVPFQLSQYLHSLHI